MSTSKLKKAKYGLKELEKELGELTFGQVLKAHREAEELTQIELAKKLGISKQSLNDLERGRRIPSPSRAANIAKKLGMLEESFIEIALSDHLREEKLAFSVTVVKKKKKVA